MVQLYKRKGGEILVNTATANNQSGGNIALLPGGGFVIVWVDGSMTGADTSGFAVRGQRFDAAGAPVGGEFLVNGTVAGNQTAAIVATLASGRFVVTWTDASATGGDTSGVAVRGQIFEADGTPVGGEFLINTATANNQGPPAIAELSGGGFVIAWVDSSLIGGDASGTAVKAQIFNAAGAPVGGEFLANTTTLGSQGASGLNVIGLPGGGFAMVYSTITPISGQVNGTLWVQRFDAAGTKVGGETVVNGNPAGNFSSANITALNAGFIVTWAQQDSIQFQGVPVTFNVRAQLFDAGGAKLGAEFLVNTTTNGTQTNADVDRLPGGGFLITWQGPADGTADINIYGQVFDDNGARIGGEFLVNTVTDGSQTGARVDVLPSGDIVIIWTDASATGADASGSGVKMQILTLSTDAPTDIALSDTSISETAVENLAVATLSATNGTAINSHFTYTIVSDASGGAFRIDGDKLVVADNAKLDFETRPSIAVRIRVTDLNGTSYEETLAIAVGDVVTETRYASSDALAVTSDPTGFNGPFATVALAGGGYALVTNHFEIGVADNLEIRILDSAGAQVGAPIDFSSAGLFSTLVADALPDGGFVTAFVGGFTPDFFRPIRVQRFDEDGNKVGPEIFASSSHSSPNDPAIAVLDNGNFVVTWTLGNEIMGQLFDAAGAMIGGEFGAATDTAGDQGFSHIAALADGGFVVSWRDGTAVEAQLFNAAGAKVGGERVIVAEGAENSSLVALDNGTFLVTWDQIVFEDEDFFLVGIFGQLVGADGVNIGTPIVILPFGDAYVHHLAAMPGGFVVSWSQQTPEPFDNPDYLDSWAQQYDLAGRPIGEAFQLSPEEGNGRVSHVAAADNGDLIFNWDYEFYDANLFTSTNMLARIFTRASLPPTEGPDILNGTPGDDVIDGLGGNDVINGLGGDDTLTGGAGDDVVHGGGDDDVIVELDAANDQMFGEDGNDRLSYQAVTSPGVFTGLLDGGAGDDFLEARLTFNDLATMIGGGGRDRIIAGAGDVVTIDAGADGDLVQLDVFGTEFEVTLGAGADLVVLGDNFVPGDTNFFPFGIVTISDFTAGDAGDAINLADYLVADPRQLADPFAAGQLQLFQDGANAILMIDPDGSFGVFQFETAIVLENVLVSSLTAHNLGYAANGSPAIDLSLSGSAQLDFLTGRGGNDLIAGNGGSDVLFGAAGNDRLEGGGGDDELLGQLGHDILDGGSGADLMTGGVGNDTYFIDSGGDRVIEASLQGFDAVYASLSYTLAAGAAVELMATDFHAGTAAINLTGNESANIIYGNDGDNRLDGAAGADTLIGRAGNDLFFVDNAGDWIVENVGEGTDRVFASVSYTLTAGAEVELLTTDFNPGTAAINLTGNALAQAIYGNAGANQLNGGGGADSLIGFGGDDWYFIVGGQENVFESAGGGSDRISAGVDYRLQAGAEVELLTTDFHAGTAAIDIIGNEIAQLIYGNAGDNQLTGGGGGDTLIGLGGNDMYFVGDVRDVVIEAVGGGSDRIFASASHVLAAGSEVEILSTDFNPGTAAINLTGNALAQAIYGNAGANQLNGGGGADSLIGFGGDDWYFIVGGNENVFESAGGGSDRISAGVDYLLQAGAEVELITTDFNAGTAGIDLTGNELSQAIYGNAGANVLDGKGGNDGLVGLGGADVFQFTTALGAGNVDAIIDFAAGTDKIGLDDAIFTAIGGTLDANEFVVGAAAADADDRIVYNQATGQLFYDADGSGGGAAILFATLQGAPALAASDFQMI